jgi:hypothetical protein
MTVENVQALAEKAGKVLADGGLAASSLAHQQHGFLVPQAATDQREEPGRPRND